MPGDTEGTRIVMDLLRDRSRRQRVEVRYETGVSHLVTDDAGAVVGVAWRSFDETGYLRASAVVIAAGGFVMNPDMVAEYTPALGSKLFTLGSTYDDGLGIRLGAVGRRRAQAHGRAVHHRADLPAVDPADRASWSTVPGSGSSPRTATTRGRRSS